MPNHARALFIVDASHAIEENLLSNWIESSGLAAQYDTFDTVVTPIAENPEEIPLDGLDKSLDLPDETFCIPVRVVWQTSHDQSRTRPRLRDLVGGNHRRPSKRAAAKILKQHPDRAQCIAGKAATLNTLKQEHRIRSEQSAFPESLSAYIGNQAALALDVAERRLIGSRYRVPRRVVNNMMANPEFKKGLRDIAAEQNVSEKELISRAQPIFKELIATPSNFWQDTMDALNRGIVSLGYEKNIVYDKDHLASLKQVAREKPSVLLWTHKTHVDGFAFASILFKEDFPATHTLGGVNMAFGGLGFVARNSTAIFIRRSFSDDLLYKLILRHYLGYLLKKRFPLTWAFEGTRSRVGKLMPPRYGILKYVVEAAQELGLQDLQIIPVALNYDLINDVSDYAAEQQGALKTPESLRWFISYLRRFKGSHGKIYLNFGDPVVVGGEISNDSSIDLQKIAFQVGVEANRVSPITLSSLMSLVLLGIAPRALTRQQLEREMNSIIAWAKNRQIPITELLEEENSTERFELGNFIVDSGLLSYYDQGPDIVYAINEEQQGIANYYRNTIVHHFILKSIAELALLRVSTSAEPTLNDFWTQVDYLRNLFKFEFFYTPSDEFRSQVDDELRRYNDAWESQFEEDTGFAQTFLQQLTPHFSHSALLPFIEAYAIVAGIFVRLEEGETLEKSDCVNQALKYGKQLLLQNRVRSQASIGKLVFENGFKLLESRGLSAADASQDDRKAFSRELWAFSNRIATIRAMASPADFEF